jgi:hypothetical protein
MVHVVDGGYESSNDGQKLIDVINKHYEGATTINHVVLTHSDTDHASGLKHIVETCSIGTLWMNRPWAHVDDLLPFFVHEYTRDGLISRLKRDFPHVVEIEEIAKKRSIPIKDIFQGDVVGQFVVLAPSKARYAELVKDSEKTPITSNQSSSISSGLLGALLKAARYVRSVWGEENLKGNSEGTTRENEMSVVQYANLSGNKILLTGDVGIEGLEEAYQYAISLQIPLPGVNHFQTPHHGARRNLSSDILDKWLGPKLPHSEQAKFSTIISANANDEDHPKKAVIRALMHRGAHVATTKNQSRYWFFGKPLRQGWAVSIPEPYPEETEDDSE